MCEQQEAERGARKQHTVVQENKMTISNPANEEQDDHCSQVA